jgi:predicted DNA-binding protein
MPAGRPIIYIKKEDKPTLVMLDREVHKLLQQFVDKTGRTKLHIVTEAVEKYLQENL